MTDTPDSIDCSAQPFDLAFHPQREYLVAAALVDGTLEVHDFSPTSKAATSTNDDDDDDDDENDTIVASIPVHTQLLPTTIQGGDGPKQASCTSVRFSTDGSRIYTGGSAGDFCALDAEIACTWGSSSSTTNKNKALLWRLTDAHRPKAIHTLHQLPIQAPTGPLLVTGDEDGGVRLWDERVCSQTRKAVLSWNDNTDYISGFDHNEDGTTLLASSADCTLSIFDLRKAMGPLKASAVRRSDDQDDELLSVKVMKHGKKVVCGTQEGVLAVWSWGTWGDISDRFPGHPVSIDALLKVDEDTLLTGCSDGLVRVVQIHPDKLIGVLGDHDGYPIEKLQFNANRSFVGSVSHDNLIRLWDAQVLQDNMEDDNDDDEEEDDKEVHKLLDEPIGTTPAITAIPAVAGHDSDNEWDDMDEDEDMDDKSDDDDDSDDEESDNDNKKVTMNDKRASRFKNETEKFFEDL